MKIEEFPGDLSDRIAQLRRELHSFPELAFEEYRTAAIVANRLAALGIEVHRGLARTGVVGVLRGLPGGRSIGLRADMDALPLVELNTFSHRSKNEGCMHACGHDGHTAMLLGAAEILAARQAAGRLRGTIYLIFQPAEEHAGGGRSMVEEGLFERFPMDFVFGMHNWPGLPEGSFAVFDGPVMAGADQFEVTLTGKGGHAAMPHRTTDVVLAGSALVQAFQSLISRNCDPLEPAVLSVTRFHAGFADNVMPETATLGGTVRGFSSSVQEALAAGMHTICAGIGSAYGIRIDLRYIHGYPPTINDSRASRTCRRVAAGVVGSEHVLEHLKPSMGAEDFSYLSRVVPGCYVWLGNGLDEGGCMLHSPHYDFNDAIIPVGITYWVQLAESVLASDT